MFHRNADRPKLPQVENQYQYQAVWSRAYCAQACRGITLFRLGPHVVAWASSLDQAQDFARKKRMPEVTFQHIKMEAGDYSGIGVKEELEHL